MSSVDVTSKGAIQLSLERHNDLWRLRKNCPSCGAPQVQLTHWFCVPAEWKCRVCKHKFEYEPFIPDPV